MAVKKVDKKKTISTNGAKKNKSAPAKAKSQKQKVVPTKSKPALNVKSAKKQDRLEKPAVGTGKKPTNSKPIPVAKKKTTKTPTIKVAAQIRVVKKATATAAVKTVALPRIRAVRKELPIDPSNRVSTLTERSILDQPPVVVLRYSDADLAEFKEVINKRMETAQHELNYLQGMIVSKDGNEVTGTKTGSAYDGDDPNEVEHISQLIERQIKFINNLRNALVRIENKTYGICRATGKLIEKARLKAVPHATLCIEAKTAK